MNKTYYLTDLETVQDVRIMSEEEAASLNKVARQASDGVWAWVQGPSAKYMPELMRLAEAVTINHEMPCGQKGCAICSLKGYLRGIRADS